jgi:hypothetical protein
MLRAVAVDTWLLERKQQLCHTTTLCGRSCTAVYSSASRPVSVLLQHLVRVTSSSLKLQQLIISPNRPSAGLQFTP